MSLMMALRHYSLPTSSLFAFYLQVPSKGVPLSKREGLDWEGTLTLPGHPPP